MFFAKRLNFKIPLAWLQLLRGRTRMLVALAGISFADILMFLQLGFQNALYETNTRIHEHLLADLVLINPQSVAMIDLKPFPRSRLYQSLSLNQVVSVAPAYTDTGPWKNPKTGRTRFLMVIGVDPAKPLLDLPEVNRQLNLLKLPDVVLFDRASRPEYGPIAAEFAQSKIIKTELNNHQIRVGGLVTIGTSFTADGHTIASDQTFLRLFPEKRQDKINLGLIRLKPGADLEVARQQLDSLLPDDVRVLTKQGFVDLEKHYWATSTAIGFIFAIGTGMGFLVGTIIVYQILFTEVSDHLPEYATLLAMGYKHRYFLGVVFQEAVILALLGFIPGFGISLGLYQLTRGATQLPMVMTLSRTVTVLVLTILMCACSGAIAARRLKDADPADIF